MEQVIYSNKGGMGIITNSFGEIGEYVNNVSVTVNDELLKPKFLTTLSGMFSEPVPYVGCLIDKPNHMVFFLGVDEDLFNSKCYFSCFVKINEYRIANKYAEGTARDFIWKDGKWK